MAIAASYAVPFMMNRVEIARAHKASDEAKGWLEAGIVYYAANGAWPADANTLVSSGYMQASDLTNPWGGSYSLAVNGSSLQVSTVFSKYPEIGKERLPLSAVTGSTVTARVTPPGTEAAHSRLLNRYGDSGNNKMFAALDMGSYDILSAGTLYGTAANLSTLNATTGNLIAVNASAVSVAANLSAATATVTGALTADSITTNGLTVNGTLSATTGNITGALSADSASITNNVSSSAIQLNSVVTQGAACSPNGLQGRDSTGKLLSCSSGVWASGGGITTSGGTRQLWRALASKTISCSASWNTTSGTAWGYVDADGTPYVRLTQSCSNCGVCPADTGWVAASSTKNSCTGSSSDTAVRNVELDQHSVRMYTGGYISGESSSTSATELQCSTMWDLGS